ncbi:hypothetical protein TELCIR_17143 [Teladorsagia circumcincta]|uniref:Uncharacterized protein n=1 Tax=Teladorsagia circumcincta TaxID=45464 RepID=A0A2G9TTJ9_TELCI|nr:hypothetical protein TELCIR_17143 [Teladorsagia circumcincta]
MSVQPHTPMNPASQQTIPQPSSVQQGPASVAPGTPASIQPAPQSSSTGEPTQPYLQDPVAHSKQLIMKDLRFSIIRLIGSEDDSGANLAAVNTYIDQTKQLQAAFDRAFSHVGRTLETIRRRQNMGSKNPKLEPMDM